MRPFLRVFCYREIYGLARVEQAGKNVLATILVVCPLVRVFEGRK
jgi:hypothetical protein